MTPKLIEILIMEGIAILMFVLAYLIGVRKKMWLVAGYNKRSEQFVSGKAGLARLVARLCVLIGIATAVMPVVTSFWCAAGAGYRTCIGVYGGFIVGVIALTMLQTVEYTRE